MRVYSRTVSGHSRAEPFMEFRLFIRLMLSSSGPGPRSGPGSRLGPAGTRTRSGPGQVQVMSIRSKEKRKKSWNWAIH